jgi:hypothetical protein
MLHRIQAQVLEGTTVAALETTLEQELFRGLPTAATHGDLEVYRAKPITRVNPNKFIKIYRPWFDVSCKAA